MDKDALQLATAAPVWGGGSAIIIGMKSYTCNIPVAQSGLSNQTVVLVARC